MRFGWAPLLHGQDAVLGPERVVHSAGCFRIVDPGAVRPKAVLVVPGRQLQGDVPLIVSVVVERNPVRIPVQELAGEDDFVRVRQTDRITDLLGPDPWRFLDLRHGFSFSWTAGI